MVYCLYLKFFDIFRKGGTGGIKLDLLQDFLVRPFFDNLLILWEGCAIIRPQGVTMRDTWLERFKKLVVPELVKKFKPETVIVFGSQATGNAHENSDIDVIIIAGYFKDITFIKRIPLVKKSTYRNHGGLFLMCPTGQASPGSSRLPFHMIPFPPPDYHRL